MSEELKLWMLKHLYPREIKGYEEASRLLELSPNGLRSRIKRGDYIEGYHFERKGHKTVVFHRDHLIDSLQLAS